MLRAHLSPVNCLKKRELFLLCKRRRTATWQVSRPLMSLRLSVRTSDAQAQEIRSGCRMIYALPGCGVASAKRVFSACEVSVRRFC